MLLKVTFFSTKTTGSAFLLSEISVVVLQALTGFVGNSQGYRLDLVDKSLLYYLKAFNSIVSIEVKKYLNNVQTDLKSTEDVLCSEDFDMISEADLVECLDCEGDSPTSAAESNSADEPVSHLCKKQIDNL